MYSETHDNNLNYHGLRRLERQTTKKHVPLHLPVHCDGLQCSEVLRVA